ncbi:major facilitator superfamily domain-containing protein [Tuber borchii]|uniref:Probable transporter MCH1 n=1 Tax=Tuber borchii TaxID=42251 RepID=A0A2T6ZDH5_TUBBO|nr:major facilitator superfamily domain-containing protein [Tuber borchii]
MIDNSPPPPFPLPTPDPDSKRHATSAASLDFGCTNNSLEWKYVLIKWTSFACAIVNCLCAGSILLFSLWAPTFQQKLGFSQMQVNAISIAGELGMYLPVPIFGYICDTYGPAKLSLLSSAFFCPAYLLAAHAFANQLPFPVMVLAFVFVGMGTSSMYFAGVTTSAKNFTGNRGLALSLPIAAFGLSSLWQSQLVSRVFTNEATGELAIAAIFRAYSVFLVVIGILGALGLKVIKSDGEISRTGERDNLLEGGQSSGSPSYGTIGRGVVGEEVTEKRPLINNATREFLGDNTMWFFAAGVFLVTGPGEAFINNASFFFSFLSA